MEKAKRKKYFIGGLVGVLAGSIIALGSYKLGQEKGFRVGQQSEKGYQKEQKELYNMLIPRAMECITEGNEELARRTYVMLRIAEILEGSKNYKPAETFMEIYQSMKESYKQKENQSTQIPSI